MKYIALSILLALVNICISQNISGKILDDTGFPMEFVTVILSSNSDTSHLIQGSTSDSVGSFSFQGVKLGSYQLKFQINGYKEYISTIQIVDQPNQLIKDVVLSTDNVLLDAITVKAIRETITKTSTGFIMNASATLSQQGGSAIDLLRNTPTIFVDGEDNVSLRGKAPMILINGRNSKLSNLANIPASSIEKLEIITNPGAQFDAESENGIINIVFKKGKSNGVNGAFSIASGYGAKARFNSSALVNYKKNKINIGLGYDNKLADRIRKATGDRINFNLPLQYFLTQNRHDDRNEGIHNLKGSFDYEDDKNILGFEVIYAFEDESNYETLFNTFKEQSQKFVSKSKRFSEELRNGTTSDLALRYERKLRNEGQKLSIILSRSPEKGQENTNINTLYLTQKDKPINDAILQRTNFGEHSFVTNVKVDYLQKIRKGTFETGYKLLWRRTSNDFSQEDQLGNKFIFVDARTGVLKFDEKINALYGLYKNTLSTKWDYEVGLRAEQTNNNGRVETQNLKFDNSYLNLFPSLNLGYAFTDLMKIRISYAKRINRPGLGQLNPFTDITDSLTQRSGNPQLKPEISNNFDLSFFKDVDQTSLQLKLYYRNSKNSILPFTFLKPGGVLFSQPLNVGQTNTLGIEYIFSTTIGRNWQTNISTSLFNQKIEAENIEINAINSVWSWNAKWINNFTLWKDAKLQIIGVYNSPTATIQGTRIAIYNTDLAFQQKILGDKARIGLAVTDIFDTQKNGFTWETKDFSFSRIFKVDTRAILATFAYTFGTNFKEKLMENKFSND